MSDEVTIRRAVAADLDDAARLWRGLQDEHAAMDPRHRPSDSAESRWRTDFGVWIASDVHRVLVAEVAGEVVGLATAHTYWPMPVYEQEMEAYLTELVVAPEHRGGRIGARLVDAVRAWAQGLGVRQVRVGVLSRNERGRAFWARQGAEDLFVTVTLPVTVPVEPEERGGGGVV
jgi:GNAT superfamily N-acetyltransferase